MIRWLRIRLLVVSAIATTLMWIAHKLEIAVPPHWFAIAVIVFAVTMLMTLVASSRGGKNKKSSKSLDDSGQGSRPVIGGEDHRRSKSPFQNPDQY